MPRYFCSDLKSTTPVALNCSILHSSLETLSLRQRNWLPKIPFLGHSVPVIYSYSGIFGRVYFKRINFCRDLCHGVVEHSLIRVVNDGGFIGLTFALKGIFGVKMIFRMLMVPKSVKKHLFFKLLYSNVDGGW